MQRSERDGERQGRDGPAAASTGGGDDGGESSDLRTKHGKCRRVPGEPPFVTYADRLPKKKVPRGPIVLAAPLTHLIKLMYHTIPHQSNKLLS